MADSKIITKGMPQRVFIRQFGTIDYDLNIERFEV